MSENKTDRCSYFKEGKKCQGGLIELVSYGVSDTYLIGNPQNGLPIYRHSPNGTLTQITPTSSLEFIWLEGLFLGV